MGVENNDVALVAALESLLAVVAVVGGGEGIEEASNGFAADLKNIDWRRLHAPNSGEWL